MPVLGGLGNNEPRDPSGPIECLNITYEINHQRSVGLADDRLPGYNHRQRAIRSPGRDG
jgi:hypothetical protein